jgi:glutathione-regulated potassium-efflux system protein KefB
VATGAFIAVKAAGIYAVARSFGATDRQSVERVALFAQGGEFAFVLYSAALAEGIFDANASAVFTAVVIISMALTPLTGLVLHRILPEPRPSLDGIEVPDGLRGNALIIGFGRFGQVASQALLARGFEVSIIENDVDMIRAAGSFGFQIYYGDGTRLDILHASGAGRVDAVLVCVDDKAAASRIVELVKAEFPLTKLFVRVYDRGHAIEMIHAGVDYQIREVLESALVFGEAVLRGLGVPDDEAAEITADVRRRDDERLDLQVAGGIYAGQDLMIGNAPRPGPLTRPRAPGRVVRAPPAEHEIT